MLKVLPLIVILLFLLSSCELFEEDEVTYDYPTITKIKIAKIPDANDIGADWDALSAPDIFCQVIDSSGIVYYTSSTKQDVTVDEYPLIYRPNYLELLDSERELAIAVWDEDISTHDLIDIVGPFTAQAIMDDSVNTWTMFNYEWTLEVSVTLKW